MDSSNQGMAVKIGLSTMQIAHPDRVVEIPVLHEYKNLPGTRMVLPILAIRLKSILLLKNHPAND
jgi:hypothetical protein